MSVESVAVQGGQFLLSGIISKMTTYINLIKKCEDNLNELLVELESLRAEKDTIDDKVLCGKENSEIVTPKAEHWFKLVRELTIHESMKRLMNTDMRVAKVMLRLMKTDLKKLVKDGEPGEMRDLVVKVMKDVAKRNTKAGSSTEASDRDANDKQVSEVLEKLMKETINEFKKLIQNDEEMAIAAMHLLETHKEKGKFKELTEMDVDVAEIIAKARQKSDEEEFAGDNYDDEIVMKGNNDVNVNTFKQKVKNLLKPVGDLILNEEVLKTLPENIRLGMEAMGIVIENRRELKAELMDSDNAASHRYSCCCVISCDYFSTRYDMSVAAETILTQIKHIFESKPGSEEVTRLPRIGEIEGVPTNCVGLESRNKLFEEILNALASNNVHAVGVYGMGGTGKTTLAKELANTKAEGIFETTVMVQISESPNIEYIQDQLAEGLGLKLHDVHGIQQRAMLLYKRLKPGEESGGRKDDNSKKILIVLDNIWKEIDLLQIGIPREYCKLLLTSREENVCKAMDVHDGNIFKVGFLNDEEAKDLFQFQVQREVYDGKYKVVADLLLEKCGGLPLSIVATANSLKGHELPLWQQFAQELEKPISCQTSGGRHETFSILRTSYEVMASEEKRKFFLLACLFPVGSTISIDIMMRYGIGLGLFQHVNKLSEAIEQAQTWAEELMSSSMLLKGDSKDIVKVHDVVRESMLFFASKTELNKDNYMILVDAIPRWIFKETFNQYTCISLLSQANYARLNGVKADLLQILLLNGNDNINSVLKPDFFQGMTNLKVLELANMNFEEGLPESMGKLKDLRTLHLVGCKLGDIKLISKLESLLVLSLRGSFLEELPDEIGKLYQLCLLDLSKCRCEQPRIPGDVINRISNLEGLYLVNSNFTVVTQSTSNDTRVINGEAVYVLNKLDFLNVLEMSCAAEEAIFLPIDDQFVKNLDKFQIHFGGYYFTEKCQPFHRVLTVANFDVNQELKKYTCLKALFKKADFFSLGWTTVKNIVPQLDEEGFKDLCHLKLDYLYGITRLCEGKVPIELFLNLRRMKISNLSKLEELLPINSLPRNLSTLEISSCESLTYIFGESRGSSSNNESDIIELPYLTKLRLRAVNSLRSVVKGSNIDDSRHQGFFSNKVNLPSLEELTLDDNDRIIKLWSKESNMHSFGHLKSILICKCSEIETMGPPSMFISLVQLESLTVRYCHKMQQVISRESEGQEITDENHETIRFPRLKFLSIGSSNNFECFYGGSYTLQFPRLEILSLEGLDSMTKFSGCGDLGRPFFHEKIEFLNLEELTLMVSSEVMVLWDLHELMAKGNHIPILKKLKVSEIKLPSMVFHGLSCLEVEPIGDAKFVLSSSENEGCVGAYSQFPKLEELIVRYCPDSVEQLLENDGSATMLKFCGQLRRLELVYTSNMEVICLHLFKNLSVLYIKETRWEYLVSANGGLKQLQSLQELDISECEYLEVLIKGGDKDNVVVFPCLKVLSLRNMSSMRKFSSIPETPLHFPSLEILTAASCCELETITGPFVAPRLKELCLKGGTRSESLFSGEPNQVIELPCLEQLIIQNYRVGNMKCVSTRPLKAPKLRGLHLGGCPKMEWLLIGNTYGGEDLELPSLELININRCPNLKSFSQAVLRAPKLRLLEVDEEPHSFSKSEDLNQLLQSIAEKTVEPEADSDPEIQNVSELDPESEPKADTKLNLEPDTEYDLGGETIANP